MKQKTILPLTGIVLALVLVLLGWGRENRRVEGPTAGASHSVSTELPERGTQSPGRVSQPVGALSDPALQIALAEKDPARRLQLLGQWAEKIDARAMPEKLAEFNLLEDARLRKEICETLLLSCIERDLSGMLVWFARPDLPGELREQGRDILVEDFGGRDPVAMFSWMEQELPDSVRLDLYGPFFRQWAKDDPKAASRKLTQLSEGMRGQSALWDNLIPQVASEWGKKDRAQAIAWLRSLPKSGGQSLSIVQMLHRWTETDPAKAAAYASKENDPLLVGLVAEKWAEKDPKMAAVWAKGLSVGESKDAALTKATAIWAQTDPRAVAAWAGQFPEGPQREQMMGQLLSSWAASNADEAKAWLQKLPAARSRDFAVSAFCNVVDGTDPAISFQYAGTILDPALRNQRLERAGTLWLKKDPQQARVLIAQSGLPKELKSKLMSQ